MSIREVSSVYECFHPLELFLKLTGFLPIFWQAERHSTRQRITNWTNLVANVVICFLVSHVGLKLEREHHIDGTNFARKIIINEVVTYVTPQTAIVLAFVMARRVKKIFHKLQQIDWEIRSISINYINYREQRRSIVAYTSLHAILQCLMILVHYYVFPVPVVSTICALRYNIYMVAFAAKVLAILWLVWIRFNRLSRAVRY